jgi:hypothetical protein
MLITFKLFLSLPAFVFDRAHKRVSLNFNPPALTYCLQDHMRAPVCNSLCVCDCVAKVYVRKYICMMLAAAMYPETPESECVKH